MAETPPAQSTRRAVPDPPQGFTAPRRLGQSSLILTIGGAVLTLVAGVAFFSLYTTVQPGGIDWAAGPITLWIPPVAGIVLTVLFHEGIHGLAYRHFGYEIEYGLSWDGFYTAAPGQLHSKRESIWITVAPLLVVTPLGLLYLFSPAQPLAQVGLYLLVLNTAGSIADLEQVGRLLGVPSGTLICDGSETYIYLPRTAV